MGLDKEDIKALIAILQKGLIDDGEQQDSVNPIEEDDNSHIMKPTKKSGETRSRSSGQKKKQRPKFENKFLSMSESSMHKDDTIIDKKLIKAPPTKRNRQYQNVQVKCRVCGKEESVSPALIDSRERYKCNKCSTSPG